MRSATSWKLQSLFYFQFYQAFPGYASIDVLQEYQSLVLLAVINHILDGSLLQVGSSKQSAISKLASNINSFASKLVDKLWIGIFLSFFHLPCLFCFFVYLLCDFICSQIHFILDAYGGSL